MSEEKHTTVDDWLKKARSQLKVANNHLETRVNWSDAVQAAQQVVELSVKSLLLLLNVEFPPKHKWSKDDLRKIADQINQRRLIDKMKNHGLYWPTHLPRYLAIMNLWGDLYLFAKYGLESVGLASSEELFQHGEAELAVEHANECLRAASELSYLQPDKLASIIQV